MKKVEREIKREKRKEKEERPTRSQHFFNIDISCWSMNDCRRFGLFIHGRGNEDEIARGNWWWKEP